MDKDRYGEIAQRLFKDPEFQEFNIRQITTIALGIQRAEQKAYAEGLRDGVIEYRKAASRGEDIV